MQNSDSPSNDPFFLRLEDAEYFHGRSKNLPVKWPRYRWVVYSVLGLEVVGIYLLIQSSQNTSWVGLIIMLVGIVAGVGYWRLNLRRHQRLAESGRLVMGVLTDIKGDNITRLTEKQQGDYQITAHFTIEPSPGKQVKGSDYAMRNDLKPTLHFGQPSQSSEQGANSAGQTDLRINRFMSISRVPLPKPGTPVAVWYCDDQNYQML